MPVATALASWVAVQAILANSTALTEISSQQASTQLTTANSQSSLAKVGFSFGPAPDLTHLSWDAAK